MSETAPVTPPVTAPATAAVSPEPTTAPVASVNPALDVGWAFNDNAPVETEPTAVNAEWKPVGQSAEQKQAAFYQAIQWKTPEEVVALAAEWRIVPSTENKVAPEQDEVQVAPKQEEPKPVKKEFDLAKADSVLQAIKDKKQQGENVITDPTEPWSKEPENESDTLKRISELEQAIETEKAEKKALEFTAKEKEKDLEYQIKAKEDANSQLRNKLSQYESNVNLFEVKDPLQKTIVESAEQYSAEPNEDNLYVLLWAMAQYWQTLTKQDISANIANLKQVVTAAKNTPGHSWVVNYAKSLAAMQANQNAWSEQQKEAEKRKAKALDVS